MNARRLPPRSRQRGMSMLGVFAVIGIAIFLGLFAIKVGPAYMENLTIEKIVEDKAANESLMKSPRSKVYASLNQAYRTNNLWDLKAEDTVKLKKNGKQGYLMTVQYERRANLFANIDLITVFGDAAVATDK